MQAKGYGAVSSKRREYRPGVQALARGLRVAVWARFGRRDQACRLLERRGAAELGEGAAEPDGAHEDQYKAADDYPANKDDPANAASVAAILGVYWWP